VWEVKKKTPPASNMRSARGRTSNIVISRIMCVCVCVCVCMCYIIILLLAIAPRSRLSASWNCASACITRTQPRCRTLTLLSRESKITIIIKKERKKEWMKERKDGKKLSPATRLPFTFGTTVVVALRNISSRDRTRKIVRTDNRNNNNIYNVYTSGTAANGLDPDCVTPT